MAAYCPRSRILTTSLPTSTTLVSAALTNSVRQPTPPPSPLCTSSESSHLPRLPPSPSPPPPSTFNLKDRRSCANTNCSFDYYIGAGIRKPPGTAYNTVHPEELNDSTVAVVWQCLLPSDSQQHRLEKGYDGLKAQKSDKGKGKEREVDLHFPRLGSFALAAQVLDHERSPARIEEAQDLEDANINLMVG